jgi:hypothetical protein
MGYSLGWVFETVISIPYPHISLERQHKINITYNDGQDGQYDNNILLEARTKSKTLLR